MLKHNILLKYSCPIYWRRCEFGQSRRSRVLSISDLCVFAQFCYDWALGEWLRNGTAGLMKTKAILLNPSCYKWGIKAGILAQGSKTRAQLFELDCQVGLVYGNSIRIWKVGAGYKVLMNPGVDYQSLLQGTFMTQGSKLLLLHWQVGSLPLAPSGKPQWLHRADKIWVNWL